MPTKPRRFDRAEIIRAAIVKSIDARAHLVALIQHEKALRHPDPSWIIKLELSLGGWRCRQERALRLDLRREYTPRERIARDENDDAERCRYTERTGDYRPAWDEERVR